MHSGTFKRDNKLQYLTMRSNQKVELISTSKWHDGQAAILGSKPTWTTTDSTLVDLVPSSDGLTCIVFGKLKSGECRVTVEATGATGVIAFTTHFELISPYADAINVSCGIPQTI